MSKYSYVALSKSQKIEYPTSQYFFRPSVNYPEYDLKDLSPVENNVYGTVRNAFFLMGFDKKNYGTSNWNPLSEIIKKNETVLIKPNLVMDYNANQRDTMDSLITHPSVVAPVIDYVIKALDGTGRIIVGDAPMQECNFNKLITISGYKKLINYYQKRNIKIELVDFRDLKSIKIHGLYHSSINNQSAGKVVDLGRISEFANLSKAELKRLRISNYDPKNLISHHTEIKHEYCIAKELLSCDTIINMPKPKTHRKAGVTISLKNLVGINSRKEYLPHHTLLSQQEGGDEYKKKNILHRFRSFLVDKKNSCDAAKAFFLSKCIFFLIHCCSLLLLIFCKEKYSFGSWYGNNTISKTVVDLNIIAQYSQKDGKLTPSKTRKELIVADMIISGEGEGPIAPSSKPVGIVAVGTNAVCFDEAISTLMGFDIHKIPTICNARDRKGKYSLVDRDEYPLFISNESLYDSKEPLVVSKKLDFRPSSGWKGHMELDGWGKQK